MLEPFFKRVTHIQTRIERINTSDIGRNDLEELFISTKPVTVEFLNKKRRSSDQI